MIVPKSEFLTTALLKRSKQFWKILQDRPSKCLKMSRSGLTNMDSCRSKSFVLSKSCCHVFFYVATNCKCQLFFKQLLVKIPLMGLQNCIKCKGPDSRPGTVFNWTTCNEKGRAGHFPKSSWVFFVGMQVHYDIHSLTSNSYVFFCKKEVIISLEKISKCWVQRMILKKSSIVKIPDFLTFHFSDYERIFVIGKSIL